MVARNDEAVEVEELGLSHEFAICRGQHDCGGRKQSAWDTDGVDYEPVVVKCVFILLPMIPCRPILALRNPTQTNVSVLVHTGFTRPSAMLGWPDIHMARAAAMVKSVWMNVPRDIHRRVLQPSLSPRRPANAPRMKERTEQSAWRSVIVNKILRGSLNNLARVRASW